MFCIECGKEIPNGVKFCPDCGASQIVKITEEKTKKKEIVKKVNRFYSTSDIPQLKKLTVSELKEKLNLRNLPTSGNKLELIRKLLRAPVEEKIGWAFKPAKAKPKKKTPKKEKPEKRRKRQPSYRHNRKVQGNSEAHALFVLSLFFFFIGIYFFNGIWYETMCTPSRWVPDDCDGLRGAIFVCIILTIACFAGGVHLDKNSPRNKF